MQVTLWFGGKAPEIGAVQSDFATPDCEERRISQRRVNDMGFELCANLIGQFLGNPQILEKFGSIGSCVHNH